MFIEIQHPTLHFKLETQFTYGFLQPYGVRLRRQIPVHVFEGHRGIVDDAGREAVHFYWRATARMGSGIAHIHVLRDVKDVRRTANQRGS